jgi:hypothetical protein
MKYALFLNNDAEDVARWKSLSDEEAREARAGEIPKWNALFEGIQAKGQWQSGVELDEPETAKTVRVVDGRPVVTDGPYAETREVIGGLMIVECADLDEAIGLAASIPLVSRGSVEIRPVAE